MRDIKFRVFVGGTMEFLSPTGLQYFDFEGSYALSFAVDGYAGFWAHEQYEVQTEKIKNSPIMQYTGLKDKKGKEIYEGDIIAWADSVNPKNTEQVMHTLTWDEIGGFKSTIDNPFISAWGSTCGKYFKCFMNIYDPSRFATVIGNIYENPEKLNP